MLRELVPNNDQLEIGIFAFLIEFSLQSRKGFDDSNHVLMRANSPGIQDERIGYEVPFGQKLAIAIVCVSTQEAFVNGVVNNFNPRCRGLGWPPDFTLRESGNCDDTCLSSEHPPCKLKMKK